jgi:hypothetical protein
MPPVSPLRIAVVAFAVVFGPMAVVVTIFWLLQGGK